MKKGFISVLMCTRNRGPAAVRCLGSLARQDYPPELLEVNVLDDASDDGSPAELRSALDKLTAAGLAGARLFENAENVQIAAGRSFLEKKISADAELVCFLDDDAKLPPGALSALAGFLLEAPGAGAAGPRIAALADPGRAAHVANFVSWTGRYSERDSQRPLDCDWLNSTCLMVRASALREAGGFYPGFYTAHEEVDLCLRLKDSGWRVVYLPAITVLHDIIPGATKRERLYYLYRNKFLVINRNLKMPKRLAALLVALLLGVPRHIAESVISNRGFNPGEFRIILAAVFDGLIGREGPRSFT